MHINNSANVSLIFKLSEMNIEVIFINQALYSTFFHLTLGIKPLVRYCCITNPQTHKQTGMNVINLSDPGAEIG